MYFFELPPLPTCRSVSEVEIRPCSYTALFSISMGSFYLVCVPRKKTRFETSISESMRQCRDFLCLSVLFRAPSTANLLISVDIVPASCRYSEWPTEKSLAVTDFTNLNSQRNKEQSSIHVLDTQSSVIGFSGFLDIGLLSTNRGIGAHFTID